MMGSPDDRLVVRRDVLERDDRKRLLTRASPTGTSATRVERVRQRVVGHPRLVDYGAFGESVWADHAELIACQVLQDSCRPLAGLRDRKRGRASSNHLGDHRRRVFDKQIEVRSDLRGLRLGTGWKVTCGGPSAPSGRSIVTYGPPPRSGRRA
jgi:hypothetical protein